MRIAMIGQKGIPCRGGGVERHVEELSIELVRTGHEVFVYTRPHYTDPKLKSYQGVTLVSLPSITRKHLDAISHTFFSTLDAMRKKVDVIHYHGVGPSLLSWIPRIFSRAKIVGTFHSKDWEHEKWSILARVMLKMGAWMIGHMPHVTIVVAQDIAQRAKRYFTRQPLYIPSGVRIHIGKAPTRTLLKKFKLHNTPYILIASRFVRCKAIEDAIVAFKRLKESSTGTNGASPLSKLKLVLVGGSAYTDDYVRELKSHARGMKDIVFLDFQTGATLDALYAHAKLFLLPSVTEGRSLALLEAMSWGVPVAAADIPGTRELFCPGKGKKLLGLVFPPHDITAIASIMRNALARPYRIQRMSERARAHVAQEYDWSRIILSMDAMYIRLGTLKRPTFEDIVFSRIPQKVAG